MSLKDPAAEPLRDANRPRRRQLIYLAPTPPRASEPLRATKRGAAQWVAQRYAPRPATLGGRKFDLRLYLLLTAADPPRAYLCSEVREQSATINQRGTHPAKKDQKLAGATG